MRHIWKQLLSAYAARLAALVVLGVAAAGCGSISPVQTHPTSKASPSAVATTSAGLTLAEATSPGYVAKFPVVACNTLSATAQAAWTPLLEGSSTGKCAPADFLAKDVPLSSITVVDDDPNISQAQANGYGKVLVTSIAWINWSLYAGAPGVLAAIPFENGPIAPEYQMVAGGGVVTTPIDGIAAYPEQLTLVPLNSQDQTIMSGASENFALVAKYGSFTDQYLWSYPKSNPPFPVNGSDNTTPAIYDGTTTTNSVLGTYFQVDTYALNCSIGPAAGICQAAGVG